ncbi:hypothetical protein ACQP1U_02610 [Actinomycetota bacterium]
MSGSQRPQRPRTGDTADRGPARQGVVLLAALAQTALLAAIMLLGLGWGGLTWALAILQTALGLVAIWALSRRPGPWVLVVPVVCVALAAGLFAFGQSRGDTGALPSPGRTVLLG